MRSFAQIDESGVCISISESANDILGSNIIELSEVDHSLLGCVWDGNEFIAGPLPPRIISTSDFIERFNDADLEDLIDSNDKKVKTFFYKLNIGQLVDLDSAELLVSLNYMKDLNLIDTNDITVLLA